MGNNAVFASLAAQWDQLITAGVTSVIANAIAANATLFGVMLTLYITISGIFTMFGRIPMAEWVFGAVRAAIIGMLLTATGFAQYISTPLQTDIPNWIARSLSGAANAGTIPSQFDNLMNVFIARTAIILQQTSGLTQFAERMEVGLVTLLVMLELEVSFFIYEFARGMIGLLICVAPFLLGFYLFQATRFIPLNLAGAAVAMMILMILTSILVTMSLQADNVFLSTMGPGIGVDVQIVSLFKVFVFHLFGLGMTIMTPSIAMRIGGGFAPSLREMAAPALVAMRFSGRAGSAVGNSSVRAASAITGRSK